MFSMVLVGYGSVSFDTDPDPDSGSSHFLIRIRIRQDRHTGWLHHLYGSTGPAWYPRMLDEQTAQLSPSWQPQKY